MGPHVHYFNETVRRYGIVLGISFNRIAYAYHITCSFNRFVGPSCILLQLFYYVGITQTIVLLRECVSQSYVYIYIYIYIVSTYKQMIRLDITSKRDGQRIPFRHCDKTTRYNELDKTKRSNAATCSGYHPHVVCVLHAVLLIQGIYG